MTEIVQFDDLIPKRAILYGFVMYLQSYSQKNDSVLDLLGAKPILCMYMTMKFGCILYHIIFLC